MQVVEICGDRKVRRSSSTLLVNESIDTGLFTINDCSIAVDVGGVVECATILMSQTSIAGRWRYWR
jgi:hypothetical protein